MTTANTKAVREYRNRHPERVKAARRKRREADAAWRRQYKSNPETWGRTVMPNIRHRAKKAGLECTITADDLKVPPVCPVLGVPFTFSSESGRAAPYNPSVDRFDNSRGYVPGNVKVISVRANQLKSDASLEEMERVVAYMRGEVR